MHTLQDLFLQAGLSIPAKSLAQFLRVIQWWAGHPEFADDDLGDPEVSSPTQIREELVAIRGISPAAADEILLRAFEQPRYPLDRATYRILLRHGWIDSTADYDETSDLLIRATGEDPNLLLDLSLWFDRLGRTHCRPSGPACDRCPLQPLLPEEGPLELES